MLRREVAHDGVRLPKREAVVVDRRHEPGRVHAAVLRRRIDAVLHAGVDALVLEPELFGGPQRLLHVYGIDASPDLQHLEADGLSIAARVTRDEVAAVQAPDELRAAELVVVVDG